MMPGLPRRLLLPTLREMAIKNPHTLATPFFQRISSPRACSMFVDPPPCRIFPCQPEPLSSLTLSFLLFFMNSVLRRFEVALFFFLELTRSVNFFLTDIFEILYSLSTLVPPALSLFVPDRPLLRRYPKEALRAVCV